MYHREFKSLPRIAEKFSFEILSRSYPNYQPIYRNGRLVIGADRGCLDRWDLIKKEIFAYKAGSVLDIGSAEGFYAIQAAKECGCFSLGLEADVRRFAIAQHQVLNEKIMPAGFVLGVADENLLGKMPNFDVVIFMSVMHHMMYSLGVAYCERFLKALHSRINKLMIFEMGQSDETENKWAKDLPDMGSNPHEWIKNFLLSNGFSKVTKIGETDSYKKDRKRALFTVEA